MVQIVYSNCACVFMVNDITLLHVMMCLVKFLLIWHILMEVVVAIMTIGKIIYMYAVTTHIHCKNRLVVLTTGWLPQLQTIASYSYLSFTLVYDRD